MHLLTYEKFWSKPVANPSKKLHFRRGIRHVTDTNVLENLHQSPSEKNLRVLQATFPYVKESQPFSPVCDNKPELKVDL